MALGICRIRSGALLSRLPCAVDGQQTLLVTTGCTRIPVASLTATYGGKYPYAEPFRYEFKRYNMFTALAEQTVSRFNDNTKVSTFLTHFVGVGPGMLNDWIDYLRNVPNLIFNRYA